MIKYFYYVEFSYTTSNGRMSRFDLGIFSTKKNAIKKINLSKGLFGFKDYPITNFKIVKFGVSFDENIMDKSNVILYQVYHEYDDEIEELTTCYTIFDYFSSKEKALDCIEHLRKHSRLGKKYPNNFEIIDTYIDNYNSWSEGFEEVQW